MNIFKQHIILSVMVIVVLMVFVGCSAGKPSNATVEKVLRQALMGGVPGNWIGNAVRKTTDVKITSVKVEKWGNYNRDGKYWPVTLKVVGSARAIIMFDTNMGRHNFDNTSEYKLFKDDYGEWEIELMR